MVEIIILFIHILGLFAIVIPLLVMAPSRNSGRVALLDQGFDSGVHPDNSIAFWRRSCLLFYHLIPISLEHLGSGDGQYTLVQSSLLMTMMDWLALWTCTRTCVALGRIIGKPAAYVFSDPNLVLLRQVRLLEAAAETYLFGRAKPEKEIIVLERGIEATALHGALLGGQVQFS